MLQATATSLMFDNQLPARARLVFIYLSHRSNKENTCFPAISTIAKEIGVSVSTVKRALNDLVQTGYLNKANRYRSDHGQTSNLYTLFEQPEPVETTQNSETKPQPIKLSKKDRFCQLSG